MAKTPQLKLDTDYQANKIINGNFDIWQRGNSFAPIVSGYTADRWEADEDCDGAIDITRSTTVPSSSDFKAAYSLKVDVATADATVGAANKVRIMYKMEGFDFQAVAGRVVTLSFWTRSNKTGTYTVGFSNDAQTRTYVSEYTIDVANTWEQKTITVDLSAGTASGAWNYDNTEGLRISFVLQAGTDFHASSADTWATGTDDISTSNQTNWMDDTSNEFYLAQVQLVEGLQSLPFRRAGKSFAEELSMCQRYYETGNFGFKNTGSLDNDIASAIGGSRPFAVTKRIVGSTLTRVDGTAENIDILTYSANANTIEFNGRCLAGFNRFRWLGTFTADAEL